MAENGRISFAVIDDDKLIRSLVHGILRDLGMELVSSASTGEQGLRECEQNPPDLILLDINLPGADGLEILANLKSMPHKPRVIMMTSEATVARVKAALLRGADGFVVKPFTAAKLIGVIEAAAIKIQTED